MENHFQGSNYKDTTKLIEPINRNSDDRARPWDPDHPMSMIIETYAFFGLGNLSLLSRGTERTRR
nr:hypothetical protein [uncultured Pseudogulbenkiania sp.]